MAAREQRSVGLWLSLLAILEILVGFGSQVYVIAAAGTNRSTDAYFSALSLPQFFLTVAVAPLVSAIIPLLAAGDPDDHRRDTTSLLAVVIGVNVACTVISIASLGLWIHWMVPGFSAADDDLLQHLARVQFLSLVPAAACMILKASSYARRRFISAEAISVGSAALALAAMIWAVPRYGVGGAVWINVGRWCVAFVGLALIVPPTRAFAPLGAFVRRTWLRARPLILGSLYHKSDPLVDQYLSSMAAPGALALLGFGRTVLVSGVQVLSQALIAPIIPGLAVLAKDHDFAELRTRVRRRIAQMVAATAAVMLAFALFGEPLLRAVLSLRHGPAVDAHGFWLLLLFLAGIPIAGGGGGVIASAYYAMGDTGLITRISVIAYTIGVGLKFAGFYLFGIWGLASATSLYYFTDATISWLVLEYKFRERLAATPPTETA